LFLSLPFGRSIIVEDLQKHKVEIPLLSDGGIEVWSKEIPIA